MVFMHTIDLKYIRILITVLALFILAGCETTHYDFVAPTSDQGRFCVTQCAAIKETCTGNEIRRAQNEKATCERTNDIAYKACVSKAANEEQVKKCSRSRHYCSSYADTERCDKDYRTCFMNCGGTIYEYIK